MIFIRALINIFIPRFVTRYWSVNKTNNNNVFGYLHEIAPNKYNEFKVYGEYDGIMKIRGFNLFGMILFPKHEFIGKNNGKSR